MISSPWSRVLMWVWLPDAKTEEISCLADPLSEPLMIFALRMVFRKANVGRNFSFTIFSVAER